MLFESQQKKRSEEVQTTKLSGHRKQPTEEGREAGRLLIKKNRSKIFVEAGSCLPDLESRIF